MPEIMKQNRIGIWVQPNGAGTAMSLLGVDESGMDEVTEPGPDKTPVVGVDRFGNFVFKTSTRSAPGDFPSFTLNVYKKDEIDFLRKRFRRQETFAVQRRYNGCLPLDNPTGWTWLQHGSLSEINSLTAGAGPVLPAAGEILQRAASIKSEKVIELVRGSLTAQTTGETQDLNALAMLTDLSACPGYKGADKIVYAAANAAGGLTANVLATTNTGGSWTILTPDPFAADEHIVTAVIFFINDTQYRLVLGTSAAIANNVVYANFTVGAETANPTYTTATIGSSTAVEAMFWPFFDRIYGATAGDIHVSGNQGATFAAAIYTGANAINQFNKSPVDNSIWAVGASNLILQEKNRSGTFDTKVGPSGGGASTAIAVARDGKVFLGNAQSLYVSTNSALNTGGWTSLKDFGSNHVVESIKCIGDDPELLYVVVDDTTPSGGELWISLDGGTTFQQITELTNTGYNGAAFSEVDDNLILIPGDGGTLHKYAP
jgi:hypothetical protein